MLYGQILIKFTSRVLEFLFVTNVMSKFIDVNGKKVQVGNDQENAQSEKKIPTPKTEMGKKTKLAIGYLYHENIS